MVVVLLAACGDRSASLQPVTSPEPARPDPQKIEEPTPVPNPPGSKAPPLPSPAISGEEPLVTAMAKPVTATSKDGGLLVVVQAPTAGCTLRRDQVTQQDGVAAVELTLEQPGADEVVAQVITAVQLQLPASDFTHCKRARVLLAKVQRGLQYVVAPAHELVAEAELK